MECFWLGRKILQHSQNIKIQENVKIQETDILKGSFFGIRLKDFLEVGGFDEGVFLFCEERILAKKITNNGGSIGIVFQAKYMHNHSTSIKKVYQSKTERIRLLYDSRMYYNCKYNKINKIQKRLLETAMKFSIMEYKIIDRVCGKNYK